MIAPFIFLVPDFHKSDVHSVRFANGSVLRYGEGISTTISSKSGINTLDLRGYLLQRIASYVPGNPDKTANNLKAEEERGGVGTYLYQAIPGTKNMAIGIIAFTHASSSVPSDHMHELVSISATQPPKISLVRTLTMAYSAPGPLARYRLFQSQNQLLLRTQSGFEIVDSHGLKVGELPQKNGGYFVGLNTLGELVYANTYQHQDIQIFNLAARKWRIYKTDAPEGQVTTGNSTLLDGNRVQIDLDVNYFAVVNGQRTPQGGRVVRQIFSAINGKRLGRPLISDSGGQWHKHHAFPSISKEFVSDFRSD